MEFKNKEANPQSAKKLKKEAYMPFIVLLMGFMASTGYNRYKKRNQMKQQQESADIT